MSFRLEGRSSFDRGKWDEVSEEIVKQQDSGKDTIIVDAPWNYYGDSVRIGQIFHWLPWRDENENPHKYVWKLIKHKPHVLYEQYRDSKKRMGMSNGYIEEPGKLTLQKVCKIDEYTYLPEKQHTLTHRDIDQVLHDEGLGIVKEGVFLINNKGDYGRVKEVYIQEVTDEELSKETRRDNPHGRKIPMDEVWVKIETEASLGYGRGKKRINPKKPKFSETETMSLTKFMGEWMVLNGYNDIAKFEEHVNKIEETGELTDFADILKITSGESRESIADKETTNALIGLGSKEHLEQVHGKMAVRVNDAEIIGAKFKRDLVLIEEEANRQLEKKKAGVLALKEKLAGVVAKLEEEMKKIHRLITTLDIYMGVSENVIQISEGKPAKDDEPICFRQMQLYMDEEFGRPENGGLDFANIEEFDEWLIDSGNYERLVPESKCVVIVRPRREMKKYSNNPWVQMKFDSANSRVYVLIRNGDNLYRIWSDKIETQNRLFPKRDDLQEMIDELNKLQKERNATDDEHDYDKVQKEINKVEDRMFYYKRNFLMLQGIVMRTPIFQPLPLGLNILDVETHGDAVKFIYDDELSLMDGRPQYFEWLAEMNKSIKKGSRIYFSGDLIGAIDDKFSKFTTDYEKSDRPFHDRIPLVSNSEHKRPDLPDNGIYQVREYKVPMSEKITEYITEKEYNKISKKADELMEEYNKHYFSWLPSHIKAQFKYDPDYNHRKEIDGKEMYNMTVLENGEPKMREWIHKELRISYNPGDTVYGSWYSESHERKTNLTFRIYPLDDAFVINYDALLIEDIEYYIDSRIHRHHYAQMMPLLLGLREQLKEEKEWEKGFVEALRFRLEASYPELVNHPLEELIWESIDWWKNEAVSVWKRPITEHDAKALAGVEKRALSQAKKRFKLKKISVGVDNTKKVLFWDAPDNHKFVATGLTKGQFVEQLVNSRLFGSYFKWNHGKYLQWAKAKVKRNMVELDASPLNNKYREAVEANKGVVLHYKYGEFEELLQKEPVQE